MNKMSKIYISQLFTDEEVLELLEKREIGLEIIEFGIGFVLDKEDNGLNDYYKRMGQCIDNRSLSLHGPFLDLNPASFDSLVRNATLKRYNQAYDIAKRLGADRIVFHSCYYEGIYFKESYVKNSINFWKDFFADKDDNIKIHIENVLEKDMDHLIEVIDGVSNKNLSVCFDIGHANCYSNKPVEEWITRLGTRIGHIHIHNNDGISDSHNGLNNGTIDIKSIFYNIKKYCNNPSMTIEVNNYYEVDESLELINKFFN